MTDSVLERLRKTILLLDYDDRPVLRDAIAEIKRWQSKASSLLDEVRDKVKEIERLTTECIEMRKSRDHHASTIFIQSAGIERQAARIAELEREVAGYEAEFDEGGRAFNERWKALTDKQSEITQLRAANESLKAEVERLRTDHERKPNP